jgi:hypothetical protein
MLLANFLSQVGLVQQSRDKLECFFDVLDISRLRIAILVAAFLIAVINLVLRTQHKVTEGLQGIAEVLVEAFQFLDLCLGFSKLGPFLA